jgi:hypothetical protein
MSESIQSSFARAVIDAAQPMPEGLTAWNGRGPRRRFDVYRNNVAVGLIGALASRFPAAEKIVGEAFFVAMAHAFIQTHPPRSPLLLAYGDDFADFVETFEPAAEIVYLADVIRLEAARGRAYHAADRLPLNPAELAGLSPDDLPNVVFEAHPSAAIVRSAHPIVSIWAMNSGERALEPIDTWNGEDALVVRPELTVNIHHLPPGGAVFVAALLSGETLGSAVQQALQAHAAFDLTANLAGVLQAGALAGVRSKIPMGK